MAAITPKIIKNDEEYEAALARIEEIFDSTPGTAEGDECELLVSLVEKYEDEKYPIEMPDPIAAIKFRMEQQGLKNKDLIPCIGSKSKVSEVLSGKRALSLNMIRNLVESLHIPAEVLIQETSVPSLSDLSVLDKCKDFPFTEMFNKGYFADFFTGTLSKAKEIRDELLVKFIGSFDLGNMTVAMNRKSDGKEENTSALLAWRIRVMNIAAKETLPEWDKQHLSEDIFQLLAHLSYFDNGPILAKEFLNKLGIHLVIEEHLDKSYLDGSSMLMPDGRPLIALTLRYDRLDSFWFTLFHELAHVQLHLTETNNAFFDDMHNDMSKQIEKEADSYAQQMLISNESWKAAYLNKYSEAGDIIYFASQEKISPAIPAGRLRHETQNYNKFTNLVGQGTVRKMFARE